MRKYLSSAHLPVQTVQGDHCKLERIVGGRTCNDLSPIIYFDRTTDRLPQGYPDHPHRGIETITYYTAGCAFHEDDLGNYEIIRAGDVQFMTAGRGIVHSEMPGQYDQDTHGFQLWINLPKKEKYADPYFINYKSEVVPVLRKNGVAIHVLAGSFGGTGILGPAVTKAPIIYFDVHLSLVKAYTLDIDSEINGVIFVYQGALIANDIEIPSGKASTFRYTDRERQIDLVSQTADTRFIIVGGRPLLDDVFHDDFHVLTSQSELEAAQKDAMERRNGFERWQTWRSKTHALRDRAVYDRWTSSDDGF